MIARMWGVARWGIGLAVVTIVVLLTDPGQLADQLRTADLRLAILGIAALTAVHLIAAETWRTLAWRLGGVRISRAEAARRYYVAQALGGVTPANIGGDVYRVQVMRASSGGYAAAAAPVVVQRATSYLALSLLALLALAVLAWRSSMSLVLAVPALLIALAGIGLAGLLLLPAGPMRRWRRSLLRLALGGAASTEADAPGARVGSATALGLALGLAFHAASILATAILLAAVDPAAVSPASVAALAVARLAIAVPVSPSGLGIQEGALSALFVAIGLSPAIALGALLLGRLALLSTAAVGGIALAVGQPRAAALRPTPTANRR